MVVGAIGALVDIIGELVGVAVLIITGAGVVGLAVVTIGALVFGMIGALVGGRTGAGVVTVGFRVGSRVGCFEAVGDGVTSISGSSTSKNDGITIPPRYST